MTNNIKKETLKEINALKDYINLSPLEPGERDTIELRIEALEIALEYMN